jgi:hypothetical protein
VGWNLSPLIKISMEYFAVLDVVNAIGSGVEDMALVLMVPFFEIQG